MAPDKRKPADRYLYGIGEWYGRSFVHLTPEERLQLARLQLLPKGERPQLPCPPRSSASQVILCTKAGGVCSLRQYKLSGATGEVSCVEGDGGVLATTCPYRFYEEGRIFSWIGEAILGTASPVTVGPVGFLESLAGQGAPRRGRPDSDDVGHIDHVLAHPDTTVLRWCALEIQAVYFSGASMHAEFQMLAQTHEGGIPFPAGRRRPDPRSSGPKRLMPQLQIKVPTLRRWGKKMSVVVDHGFFNALGPMDEVADLSNCDIAWFVVNYEEGEEGLRLVPSTVRLTTLERAVEGLTAGRPVSLDAFEDEIRAKIAKARA